MRLPYYPLHYTLRAVARITGVSVSHLRDLYESDQLIAEALTPGGKRYVPRDELARLLKQLGTDVVIE